MGSVCDAADIDRFMRSPEGLAVLQEMRADLIGRTIQAIEFTNDTVMVGMEIVLDDGNTVSVTKTEFDIDALRAEYTDVLEREFGMDYPERQIG